VVWDRDGTVVLRIELGGTARQGRSMAVAGGELVAYLENEAITLFDLASGERTRSFSTHPGVATCLALSPDGLVVASGGSDRNLRLWNFRTGECDSTFEGHGAFLSAVAWHPTQPRLVSASADGTLRVWDVGRGVCEQILTGHGAAVRAVAVDPTGSRVVSTGEDGSVGVWRLHDGELVRFQRGHRGVVNSLAVAAGMIAAGGEDGTVRLWKMESGETIQVMRMPNPVQDLAATKGGSEILAAHGGTISRLAVPGPEPGRMPLVLADTAGSSELAGRENEFQHHLLQAKERIDAGQMEEALEPLRAARSLEGYELHDQALELWSRVLAYYPKHESRSVVELRRFGGGRIACNACAFVGEGAGCVAGFTDGSLRFFETESGSERYRVGAHDQSTLAVASSKDGRWLATAGRDGAVRVWNAADGRLEREYGGHSGSAQAVVFTPDGRSAVSGGDDGTVRIWSLDESVLPELLGSSGEAISALAVSTDGRYLVSGGWDSQVTIWSLRRRAELRRLQGHEGTVHGVAVSPDCRLMASAGEDGTIRLWDLESGRCWRELRGHDGAVLSVAFAPDGRFVLSAGKDSSLRLWDVRTGKVATTVEGHDGPVGCVALARDGGAALSSGTDASVRLWFLDWEPELPERGTWDDRVLPFLKVFIRRRESESPQGAMPTWGEHHLEELLKDLNFRGFGWLSRERVERELEKLAQFRSESRTEEREHTQQLVRQRERASRLEPVKELVGQLTHNIGLKVAAVGLAIAAVLLGLMSLRTPTGGPEFSRFQRDISMMIQAREMRLDRGTVLSYQTRASVGSQGCAEGHFPDFVDLAVEAERMRSPPLDPAVPADEGFRLRYANAVNCVGTFGTYDLADRILQRIRQGIHERREEDLLGVLVRIKASANPRFADGLLDANESVRHMVALAIVYGDDQESRERLASALQGDELRAAEAASFVIGELVAKGLLGEEEAFEVIRTLSRNIDPMVRRNAVKSLILYKNEGIVREVLNDALEDSDPDVVKAAEVTREAMRTGRIKELFG
jgi:WD40 repeat protein